MAKHGIGGGGGSSRHQRPAHPARGGRPFGADHGKMLRRLATTIPAMLFAYVPAKEGAAGGDRFVYVSSTSRDLLEVEPEALLRDPGVLWNMVPAEERMRLAEAIAAAVRAGAPLDARFQVVTPSGARKWLHARSLPGPATRGRRWNGVLLDVTDQMLAELGVEREGRSFRRLAESSPDVICRFDAGHRTIYANPAVASLGLAPDRVLGRTCREQGLPAEVCDPWEEALTRVFATGRGVRFELTARGPDGVERSHDVVVVPEIGEDGALESVLTIGRDVTEHRANEAALRDADRRKSEFLAMLSHELRNPLAPIQNALYILGRTAPGSEQGNRAQGIIERQIAHLAHLVDDLLDVTRIERNRIQLQRQMLELNELVRRTAEDHRSTFETAGVRLEVALDPMPLFVDADPTRLSQVVANLLHNASKFTPRGGTTRVAVRREGERATITVTDTGVGMSEELLARIFQPFAQGPSGLVRSKGGLGLGLALVKGLVEHHGGTVEARSAGPGRGSELRVTLPRVDMPQAVSSRGASAHPFRILIIEDNVDAANSLREVLEMSGHAVQVAYAGAEGVARAHELHPDVVLCDIGLPGMDGHDVARAIRADPALSATHLVALSGYALPDDVRRAGEAGFEVHLPKPPNLDRLAELLAAMAGNSGGGQAGAEPPGP